MPTSFEDVGTSLAKMMDHREIKDLLTGISDGDPSATLEWIQENIRCRTADDADYELEWK